MEPRRTKFYRDKVNAKWLGVCSGIADYFQIEALWVRMTFVVALFFGAPTPLIYLLIGVLAPKKPYALYGESPDEARFWSGVRTAPATSIRDVHSRFRDIDRRVRDLEAHVVGSNRRLSDEIERLR
jgi:phage shock protein C